MENAHQSLEILIAGGGIGGLTAALCLAQDGHRVTVCERASEFVEAGAGIQISPNASRVLHDLGMEGELREVAFLPEGTQFRHWRTGAVISESPLGKDALERYGSPYYHLHRGDLLALLVSAAESHPQITLLTDMSVDEVIQQGNRVRAGNDQLQLEGDLLVGADGIHSAVRRELWGDEQPQFTGNVAWRMLVDVKRLPEGLIRPMSSVWWGPGKHFVHYYVRAGTLVNCVCVVEKRGWEVESWTEAGAVDELRLDFAGWHDDIAQLISCAEPESLFKWALFDRAPMSQWGQGRVTLLGDACHPTLPFMAQGAAMAIEDAAVLAGCLAQDSDSVTALQRYEDLRRERTAGIQRGSRRNASVFHMRGIKAWFRNRAAKRAGQGTMQRLYSYNALQVASE